MKDVQRALRTVCFFAVDPLSEADKPVCELLHF